MITTPIELDKYRNLRFDFQAMVDLENELGMTLKQTAVMLNVSSIRTLVTVLWVGLKWEDEKLDLVGAANLATTWCDKSGGKFGDMQDILVTALIDAGWLNPPSENTEQGSGQGEAMQASTA